MRKLFALLFLCLVSIGVTAQDSRLSKEEFSQKVQQAVNAAGTMSHLDPNSRLYIDTLYHLPPPLYKVLHTTATQDSTFFYYYDGRNFDSVLNTTLHTAFEDNNIRFGPSLPMADSSSNFFILYFFPVSIEDEKLDKLDKTVLSTFKLRETTIRLESIKMEEIREEPPPPPPPPPPKPVQKKTAKKKNPA